MSNVIRHRRPTSGPGAEHDSGMIKTFTNKGGLTSAQSHVPANRDSPRNLTNAHLPRRSLSLKHTNAHFYSLVDTGVNLKVEWLVERRSLHLKCPNDRRCDLGSDLRFCRGSVPLLMQRRREHIAAEFF